VALIIKLNCRLAQENLRVAYLFHVGRHEKNVNNDVHRVLSDSLIPTRPVHIEVIAQPVSIGF
jgi:hypothetical protein